MPMRSTRPRAWCDSICRVVEAVFERRRTAVDDEDFLRPFAFELQAIRIISLVQGGACSVGVSHERLDSLRDGPRNMLHRAGLGDDNGLKQRHRNQQHLARRFGHQVGKQGIAGHQCGLAKCLAGFQFPQAMPCAAVAGNVGREPCRSTQPRSAPPVRRGERWPHWPRTRPPGSHQLISCRRSSENAWNIGTCRLRNSRVCIAPCIFRIP